MMSYDMSTGKVSISNVNIDTFPAAPAERAGIAFSTPLERIEGECFYAVTDYKTMTIHSLHSDRNGAKAGLRTYTYNKHNWNNWKQATQQEQA